MGGMSDDTRENVGLHCRLKVESVAKYHADEQDTTKAPCNSTSDYESKKRVEGRGFLNYYYFKTLTVNILFQLIGGIRHVGSGVCLSL